MASTGPITTPLTSLLGIQHPIILGGMAGVSESALAAAVSNAGGLGVIGGLSCPANRLRELLSETKARLLHPSTPFGVSLSLRHQIRVGVEEVEFNENDLIDVVVEARPKLVISALGHPSKPVIDRLHANGILIMSLVGHPKHAIDAMAAGVDIICTQGYESRGHTCEIAGPVLLQAVVGVVREKMKLHPNLPHIHVVAGGGVATGGAIAGALMHGAEGVMVSTRFAASIEAEGGDELKQAILSCSLTDTERTPIFTGRMLRVKSTDYTRSWRVRTDEVDQLRRKGIVPVLNDFKAGKEFEIPFLMGQSAGLVREIKTANAIVHDLIEEAVEALNSANAYLRPRTRL